MRAMKILFISLILIQYSCAMTSFFEVITPKKSDLKYKSYHPEITQNSQNEDLVDVKITWVDDGKSYWLVVASKELDEKSLNFRRLIGGAGYAKSSNLLVFSPLGRNGKFVEWAFEETPNFIEFTLHKSLLARSYIYHDFSNPFTSDGGIYYTVKLADYKVGKGVK